MSSTRRGCPPTKTTAAFANSDEAKRTGGSHTAPLTHTVIPPAQRVVHTSYRLAEGCIVRKKEVFFNYFIGRNTFYIA